MIIPSSFLIIYQEDERNQAKAVIFVKNIWLEKDEPRKHFFKVAYPLVASIAYYSRLKKMNELYEMYASFVSAYKKLDVLVRLYDQNVIAAFDGIEAALSIYCSDDKRFDEIFASA